MRSIRIGLVMLLVAVSTAVFSQYSPAFNEYQKLYPDAYSVILNQETTVTMKVVRGKIKINQEEEEEILYLNDRAKSDAKETLRFSSFYELLGLKAYSYEFTGKKYKEREVKDFTEKNGFGSSFHDDTKLVNFIYPNLHKGAKTYLTYKTEIKNPRFLMPFFFGDFRPIVHSKLTIICDDDIKMKFVKFNLEGLDVKFNKQEKRGKIIYTWECSDMEKYKWEASVPSYKKVLPHIVPLITSYDNGEKEIKVLDSVRDLYDWYYSLVKDVNTEDTDEELVKLVSELTKGKETEKEKVKAIYDWTQKNIKYIAFEYALGGFIPRESNDVFQKKYGDCKDNSSILHQMLDIAGIKGNLTWIGTRKLPYRYEEVPSPIVDNHMILSYRDGEDIYFLDATGRYLSLDIPSDFIQGKEALIGKGAGKYEIVTVPIVPPEMNSHVSINELEIVNGNLVGKGKDVFSGYQKSSCLYGLEDKNTEEKLKSYYNKILERGNNKFLITKVEEQNKYDYDKDFEVDYDYTIDDYVKVLDKEIYINLNLNQDILAYKTDKDREHSISFNFQESQTIKTTLKIPEGYLVDYLPDNFSARNDLISVNIEYTTQADKIIYDYQYVTHFLELDLKEQEIVNSFIKKLMKAFKEIIVFKEK